MARPLKDEAKNRPIHLGFRVSEWVRDGLQQLADQRGSPVSDIANEALVAYLKRNGIRPEKKSR